MSSTRPLRVAVVGAGPAGIYAADILSKTDLDVSIDLFERLPAPFGLVRYGVAPDHPRIKQIIVALHKVLERGDIRLLANVDYGVDLKLDDLRTFYDAVIFSTGSIRDADLDIPGIDLPESYGAADFVSWYDGHPDVPRTWPLEAREVAVLGAGNVALDVARILAKHADDLLPTEIPANVHEILAANPVTDVHVFARRGPAQVKFSPLELRELGHVPDVDIVVNPEDFDFDEGSMAAIHSSNQTKQVVKTLTDWTLKDPSELTASRRIHLHFLHRPGRGARRGRPRRRPAHRAHRAQRRRHRQRHRRDARLAGPGRLPRGGLLRLAARRHPVRRRRGRHPQPRRPRRRRRRRPGARRLRDRLDQARPGRPHRPHQVRRDRDDPPPRRGRHPRRRRRGPDRCAPRPSPTPPL